MGQGDGAAAQALGLKLQIVEVHDAADLDSALSMIAKTQPGGLIVTASPLFAVHRKRIADFVLTRRIPTMGFVREFAVDGALMSYGPSITNSYRRGALYVDRILKGAKPADLPVEQPTKSSWSSTCEPREHSASRSRRRPSSEPMRSSSDRRQLGVCRQRASWNMIQSSSGRLCRHDRVPRGVPFERPG